MSAIAGAGGVVGVSSPSTWGQAVGAVGLVVGAAVAAAGARPHLVRAPTPEARRGRGAPPRLVTFRDRDEDLRELTQVYAELRRSDRFNGPIILAIHGMPGVGKSALAQELSRRLADDFPDGQLYANLGNAGSIRAEGNILNRFLGFLQPNGRNVPKATAERAARYRTLTSSARVLVVLDAARDHEQVSRLLPGGRDCAVIVTSRRDLGPALGVHSHPLKVPDTDGALDILRAVTNTAADEDQKFAIEIVDRLGRLPLAIRAVGDRDAPLPPTARRLRNPGTNPVDIRTAHERVHSEYDRLTTDEAEAFRLLSLIEAPSFVPWVLAPLLGYDAVEHADDQPEVEKIVSRLAVRQLLEPVNQDEVTELDRYRFHPVVRGFAEAQVELAPADRKAVLDRLDEAYLEALDRILGDIDQGYRDRHGQPPRKWIPERFALAPLHGRLPDRWVRAEYANLLRCVDAAYESGRFEMCWRIAAHLGECAPSGVARRRVLDALDNAERAVGRLDDERALVEVRLARGTYLAKLGTGYETDHGVDDPDARTAGLEEAIDTLTEAAGLANRLRARASTAAVGRDPASDESLAAELESEAHRRLAELHLRLGAYRDAEHELERAARLADLSETKPRRRYVIDLMRMATLPATAMVRLPHREPDGTEEGFWYAWALGERHRRRHDWEDASRDLRALRRVVQDDTSRVATILLRLAELRFEQLRLTPKQDPERAKLRAVRRAAEAMYRFQQVHDQAGTVRARCAFVRGLLALDQAAEAAAQFEVVQRDARRIEPLANHSRSPLAAAVAWAEGELLAARGEHTASVRCLVEAARIFHMHADWAGEAGALAAAGLKQLAADSFDPGPPGRRPTAWLEGVDDAPPRVGVPFEVFYQIGSPAMTQDRPPAGARLLNVLLSADGAEVFPSVRTARLDPWAPLAPQCFEVTPRREGDLRLEVLVYSAEDGALLQRSELAPQKVVDTGDGA